MFIELYDIDSSSRVFSCLDSKRKDARDNADAEKIVYTEWSTNNGTKRRTQW